MYTVYIIYSPRFDKIYIGCTGNLENRLRGHNEWDKKGHTIKFRPWTLAYTETFQTQSEAFNREKQLKTAKGREFAWSVVREKFKG